MIRPDPPTGATTAILQRAAAQSFGHAGDCDCLSCRILHRAGIAEAIRTLCEKCGAAMALPEWGCQMCGEPGPLAERPRIVPSLIDQGDPTAVALHRVLTNGLTVWNTRDSKGLTAEEIDERANNMCAALLLNFEIHHVGE